MSLITEHYVKIKVVSEGDKILKLETTTTDNPEIDLFLSFYEKFTKCFDIKIAVGTDTEEYDSRINQLLLQMREKDDYYTENINQRTKYLQDEIDKLRENSNESVRIASKSISLEHQVEQEKLRGTIRNLEDKLKLQEEYNNERISLLDEQINQYKIIREVHSEQSSNIAKGIIGENYVFNHLLDTYIGDDYLVDKCSSKKEVGDILFKHKDHSICIESKNYVGSVRTAQITKFTRDVNNSRYDAGIIYNMNSTFVGKSLFHIDYTSENKPIIFISKLKENPIYIDISIKIILFILRNTGNKQKTVIDISFVVNELRTLITDNRDMQNTLNKSSDRLTRLVDQFTDWKNE